MSDKRGICLMRAPPPLRPRPAQRRSSPSRSWGNRRANGYQALAEDGYALLAERLRSADERAVVHGVLERVLRVKLDMDTVYARDAAAAQLQLAECLAEAPEHEFAVRPSPPLLLALCCAPPRTARRK